MNLATVLGIPVGIGLLLVAFMFEGGNPASLILPSPLIIIFGGTFGALLTGFDLSDVLSIPKLIGDAMRMPPTKEKDLALRFVALAEKSRRDGLLSLEEDMQSLDTKEDPLLKKGLRYVIDGTDSEALRELLENDVAIFEKHRKHQAEIFESAGGFSPTMGIIGTVLGLIIVLSNLSEPDKLGGAHRRRLHRDPHRHRDGQPRLAAPGPQAEARPRQGEEHQGDEPRCCVIS